MDRTISRFYSKIPPDEWSAIEGFVKDCLRHMNLPDSTAARRLYPVTVRLAHWAWRYAGYDLEPRLVFRRSVITSFIAHGCSDLKKSTRATYRSQLFRMSAVLSDDKFVVANESINAGDSNASQPYTAKEIVSLRIWAKHQGTHYRSVNAQVLLALGLGAGLTNTEIIHCRASDVTVDDDGVLIQVAGAKPRTVPMLAEWESVIATVAQAAMRKETFLLCPRRGTSTYEKTVTGFIEDSTPHDVRLTAQRMRATWIVAHMSNRVPARVIADAAGIKKVEALSRYARFIPEADPATVRAWLRGLEVSPTGE